MSWATPAQGRSTAVQEPQPQQDLLGWGALPLGHPYFWPFHFEKKFNEHGGGA